MIPPNLNDWRSVAAHFRCRRELMRMASARWLFIVVLLAAFVVPASANTPPVIDAFTASPAVPAPGQSVLLKLVAHDPDCIVPPCTSGCGLTVRSDLLFWSDGTGRKQKVTCTTRIIERIR